MSSLKLLSETTRDLFCLSPPLLLILGIGVDNLGMQEVPGWACNMLQITNCLLRNGCHYAGIRAGGQIMWDVANGALKLPDVNPLSLIVIAWQSFAGHWWG